MLRKIIWSSLKFLPRGFYSEWSAKEWPWSTGHWLSDLHPFGSETQRPLAWNIWMLRFNLSGNPLCFWVKSCELLFWSLQLCFGEFSCVNFPEIHRDLFPQPRSRLSGIGSASVPRAKRLCISEVFSWWGPACLKIGYPWLGTPFHQHWSTMINGNFWHITVYPISDIPDIPSWCTEDQNPSTKTSNLSILYPEAEPLDYF